ncbi:MAG: ABC transporter ATP-binding protein [Acidobacteria bacterium]|nr:ABC transporter ATP-binding protein [Acidobacteriota bacterium]
MSTPLLAAHDLSKTYRNRGIAGAGEPVRAVDGVSLSIDHGSTLALVGRSGSGKSTVARLLLALEAPDTGTVLFDGVSLYEVPGARLRALRRRFQAVFQDPYASLNPRLTIKTIVAEPLLAIGEAPASSLGKRVGELLERVGLPASAMDRRPASFSGGERQRVAIARALATGPDLLILDEPLSALDVSIQAQILNLLVTLREELGLTMLFISHDLTLVQHISERTAVMYEGIILEEGPTAELLANPLHPYTVKLLAGPLPAGAASAPGAAFQRTWMAGSCRFAPVCPIATAVCAQEPSLTEVTPGRRIACWSPGEISSRYVVSGDPAGDY